MKRTMSIQEVYLCMRVLGLRRDRWSKATRNLLRINRHIDRPVAEQLISKGLVELTHAGHRVTARGIDQLKLQIGEFCFRTA